MSSASAAPKQFYVDTFLGDSLAGSDFKVDHLIQTLTAELQRQGVVPREAPPLPPEGAGLAIAKVKGPFRILCGYHPFYVTGVDEQGDVTDMCSGYVLRVDTLVD